MGSSSVAFRRARPAVHPWNPRASRPRTEGDTMPVRTARGGPSDSPADARELGDARRARRRQGCIDLRRWMRPRLPRENLRYDLVNQAMECRALAHLSDG